MGGRGSRAAAADSCRYESCTCPMAAACCRHDPNSVRMRCHARLRSVPTLTLTAGLLGRGARRHGCALGEDDAGQQQRGHDADDDARRARQRHHAGVCAPRGSRRWAARSAPSWLAVDMVRKAQGWSSRRIWAGSARQHALHTIRSICHGRTKCFPVAALHTSYWLHLVSTHGCTQHILVAASRHAQTRATLQEAASCQHAVTAHKACVQGGAGRRGAREARRTACVVRPQDHQDEGQHKQLGGVIQVQVVACRVSAQLLKRCGCSDRPDDLKPIRGLQPRGGVTAL